MITRPLVFQPGRGNKLGVGTVDKHHLCRRERVENIGLVFFTHLVTQGLAREEDAVALLHQVNIKLLRGNTVLRTVNAVCKIAVLVADKDVVGRLVACLFDPFLPHALDILCLTGIVFPHVGGSQLGGALVVAVA